MFYFNFKRCYVSSSPVASSSINGFAISSIPSTGDIKLTCVPRHTTKPRVLVSSVSRYGS